MVVVSCQHATLALCCTGYYPEIHDAHRTQTEALQSTIFQVQHSKLRALSPAQPAPVQQALRPEDHLQQPSAV
jgi:hypothetical protein